MAVSPHHPRLLEREVTSNSWICVAEPGCSLLGVMAQAGAPPQPDRVSQRRGSQPRRLDPSPRGSEAHIVISQLPRATSLPGGLSPGFTSHSDTPDLLSTRSPLFDTRDSLDRVLSQAPGASTRPWWVLSHILIFSYRRSPVRPSSLRRAVETVPKTARRPRGLASAHHGPRCLFLRPDPMLRSKSHSTLGP